MTTVESDVLIIGCGVAGSAAALGLALDRQRQITMVTRTPDADETNTRYAQGGIVTLGADDSAEILINDVLAAGAGLSLPSAARILAEEGPRLVQEVLIDRLGTVFDREPDGSLSFGREAAHSRSRILHMGDATGKAIIDAMHRALRELPNVQIVTSATAVDLITFPHHARDPLTVYEPIACHGAYIFEQPNRTVRRYLAATTMLATGGLGRIYRYTSNPPGARGDGLAMAYRAGAQVINAEYVQFHPTTLALPDEGEGFLISEAVRGEGGRLLTPDGERFMLRYAPDWGDLAPRDVVARAIHHEMVEHGYPYVLLDIASVLPPERIQSRFPTICARCAELGLDITRQPVPVVPAAHFFCGGVWTDAWARTTVPNLYAVGEVACTGLHGANRLASTSLLEGLVWGDRAARDIIGRRREPIVASESVPPWEEAGLEEEADPALIWRDIRTIQHTMWHYVGLARSGRRLARAMRDLNHLREEIEDFYRKTRLNDALIGLRHSIQAALVVAEAAHHNRSSRGCHYRDDGKGSAAI